MDLLETPEAPVPPTGETLRPLLTGQAHIDIHTAFRLKDEHAARVRAYEHAVRAAQLRADGAAVTLVFKDLANAESAAPEDVRPYHAARVDAYAAEHGIKGWHRHTPSVGRPYIVMDRLRLVPLVGDKGRYYAARDFMPAPPLTYSVIDRDSGRSVYRALGLRIAQQWIDEHEAVTAS